MSTDLEIGLTHRLAAEVKKPGRFTVSAKKLYEIVRVLPEEPVAMSLESGGRLRIRCGKSDFRVVGLDAGDFPALPATDFKESFELPAGLFASLIAKVLFAVTSDESRFPLGGALFIGSESGVVLVATDGHRLSLAEASVKPPGLSREQRFIISKKALVELRKVIDLGGESVAIEARDNHIFFRLGERTLIARAVEDQFPVYEKVIPKGNDKLLHFPKLELEAAVRRVALLAPEKAGTIKLSFDQDKLTVASSSPEVGEAHEEVVCSYQEEPIEIGFNAQYLLDFFTVCETERMSIELKDGVTQGLLKPDDAGGEVRHQYVIMPMRI
jgi:DNA polymerase-3 subunit beta